MNEKKTTNKTNKKTVGKNKKNKCNNKKKHKQNGENKTKNNKKTNIATKLKIKRKNYKNCREKATRKKLNTQKEN